MHRLLVILGFLVGGLQCFSQSVSGELDGHQYVDLGLPSGTLWATCNVGATEPTGSGDYFAWGEVNPNIVRIDPDGTEIPVAVTKNMGDNVKFEIIE